MRGTCCPQCCGHHSVHMVMWLWFGPLVTSLPLWLLAMACSHVITICNLCCQFSIIKVIGEYIYICLFTNQNSSWTTFIDMLDCALFATPLNCLFVLTFSFFASMTTSWEAWRKHPRCYNRARKLGKSKLEQSNKQVA